MGTDGQPATLPRRRYLLACTSAIAAAAAGCIGDGGEPVTLVVDATANDNGNQVALFEGIEETIEPGHFHGWQFWLDWEHEIEYSVEVTDGPDVDVYMMEDAEFEALRADEDFRTVEEATWMNVGFISDTVELDEGEYWLVAMNADVEPENV